jgi:hypothetical protein
VVRQYPHILKFTPAGDSTRDTDGNWVPGTAGSEVQLQCRAEPEGIGSYLVGSESKRIDYSWIVYMPLGSSVEEGAEVTIDTGAAEITDTVKRFHEGQLNARVWL